jgi:putative ABC transport system permease protein
VTLAATSDAPRPERFRVAGIYPDPAEPAEIAERNAYLRLRLEDLDRVAGTRGAVDRIALALRDPRRAQEVAEELNAMGLGFRAHTAAELARETSQSFVVIRRFHVAISLITVLGGGVFVMAILLMKVEELRHELGVLRLIGISRRTIVKSLLLEAALLTLLGSAVSIGLGLVLSMLVNAYYRDFYQTTLTFSRVTPGIVATAVGVSVALGMAAGGFAAWRLARRSPLDLLGR